MGNQITFISILPSPYLVNFLNELGKSFDVSAVFERASAPWRSEEWKKYQALNFKISFMQSHSFGNHAICTDYKKFLLDSPDAVIIGNPLTPTGIAIIRYLKRHKKPFMLQSEGGLAKSGKGLKERFKHWVMKGADIYFSGMSPEREYFLTYGATMDKVIHFNFSSLFESEILAKPLSAAGKQLLREKLNIGEGKVVMSIGQFIHRKGFDVLLHAARMISGEAGIYLIGGEPTQEYLELIERYNLKNVHFISFKKRPELIEYYKAADMFVLPTRQDTWGLVINEAMAFGLPVVTTDNCVAGLELIENGANGYIIPVDDIEALADRTNTILNNPELSMRMAENNLEKIRNYTIESMTKSHVDALRNYLNAKNNPNANECRQVIYASSVIPQTIYASCATDLSDQQAQKFNRLVMKGFVLNRYKVHSISYLSSAISDELPEKWEDGGIDFSLLKTKAKGWLRLLSVSKQSYNQTRRILKKFPGAFVACDVLNISVAFGAVLAARSLNRKAIGFVTDVPGIMSEHSITTKINLVLIGLCTGYVFLTAQMSKLLNSEGKPFTVMEGLVDVDVGFEQPRQNGGGKIIVMYAGSIHKIYGIDMLVEAFVAAGVPGAVLHIYGTGDYKDELIKLCAVHDNIKYFGVVENSVIIEAEKRATLLVNPRTSREEFTKYSFPSKIMEYMASGTPVLMNLLPGMPSEYAEYVYLFENEYVESYCGTIRNILGCDQTALKKKGFEAQRFVRESKNCKRQIENVVSTLCIQNHIRINQYDK